MVFMDECLTSPYKLASALYMRLYLLLLQSILMKRKKGEGMMTIDIHWLEEKVLMRKLDDVEAQLLTDLVDISEYKAGDTIVEQGKPGGVLYVLYSGVADITCHSHGHDVRVATADETSLFGEMSFLTGEDSSASVVAQKDCVVYSLTRAAYSEMMQKNQDLVFALFTHILVHAATAIRHMNEEHLALQQYIMGRRV